MYALFVEDDCEIENTLYSTQALKASISFIFETLLENCNCFEIQHMIPYHDINTEIMFAKYYSLYFYFLLIVYISVYFENLLIFLTE